MFTVLQIDCIMVLKKNYLTKELIEYVNAKAREPIWRMGVLAAMTSNWYDVRSVSPLGLIHLHGNADTGWEHILNRHSYYSFTNHFGKGAQGNPSKFTGSSIPISDFVKIADDVFGHGEIDTKEHSDGELFCKACW